LTTRGRGRGSAHQKAVDGILIAAVIVALGALWRQSSVIGTLRRERSAHDQQTARTSARNEALERDLRYYKRVVSRASIDVNLTSSRITDAGSLSLNFRQLQRPTVLYSVDTRCVACVANFPILSKLLKELPCSAELLAVVAGDDTALDSLWPDRPSAVRIVRESSGSAWDVLPLAVVPSLVVLGPRGRLFGWWTGSLAPDHQSAIAGALQASCESVPVPSALAGR